MKRLTFLFVGVSLGEGWEGKEAGGFSYREYTWEINYIYSKSYKGFILDNGLEVLLVSDPFTRKAGASLVVSSGSHDDPKDTPGLAHFCEHMMHMGSTKYPNESEYSNYLDDNGGDLSATTYYNHTSYRFQVNPDALEGGLDIFAHLFIEPAMDRSSVEREINAIQSEYEYRQTQLSYKVQQVMSAALNTTHPYSRFRMGNHKTLASKDKFQIHNQVRDHHKKHYSASRMKLVVISPHLLETMVQIAVPRFSRIPSFEAQPTNPTMPFQQKDLAIDVFINPNMYTRQMMIQFVIPPLHNIAHQMAFDYISYYLMRRDANSLVDRQVKKGNAEWIRAEIAEQFPTFAIYQITIALTNAPNTDEITRDMFAYLNALKRQGLADERYAEHKSIAKSEQEAKPFPPKDLAAKLAEKMHLGMPIYNITLDYGGVALFNSSAIIESISMLKASCMRRTIISPTVKASEHEPWFNSNYSVSLMNPSLIEEINTNSERYELPKVNKMAKKKTLAQGPDRISQVYAENTLRLWQIAGSPTFEPNRLSLAFTDVKNNLTDQELVRMALLSKLAGTKILKMKGRILSVGENAEFHHFNNKLVLQIQAFDLLASLGRILYALKKFEISQDEFNAAKGQTLAKLAHFSSISPIVQAHYMAMSAIQWDEISIDAHNRTLIQTDLPSFQRWIKIFFDCHQIDALLVGKADAINIKGIIKQFQISFGDCPARFKPPGEISFLGENIYRISSTARSNSAVTMYLDLYNNTDIKSRALAALATSFIRSRFKNKIRNQEQLGYMIETIPLKRSGGGGIAFVLQSAKPPTLLESRIEAFLEEFLEIVKGMNYSCFLAKRQAFLYEREVKHPSLLEIQNFYWPTILNGELNFQKKAQETEYLKSVTKEDLVTFMARTLIKANRHRRKLSIQLKIPNQTEEDNPLLAKSPDTVVTDLQVWKKSRMGKN